MSEEEEAAIRAKLRAAGWKKKSESEGKDRKQTDDNAMETDEEAQRESARKSMKERRKRHSSRSTSRSRSKERRSRHSRHKDENDSKKDDDGEKESRRSRKRDRSEDDHGKRSASRRKSRRSRHSRSRSRSSRRSRRHRSRSSSHRHRRSRSHDRRHRRRSRRSRSASKSKSKSKSNSPTPKKVNPLHLAEASRRRDANSSPEPQDYAINSSFGAGGSQDANSISQLMAQHPTLSLQEIISKMQTSNLAVGGTQQKPCRELYIGNLPPSITGPQLQEFLGTIIQQVGLSVSHGNPILNTWISADGHFAFCEMRSVEETNLALLMNQLPLLGRPLKFGRPKSFVGPPQPVPAVSARTQTALSNLGCTPNLQLFAAGSSTSSNFSFGGQQFGNAATLGLPTALASMEEVSSESTGVPQHVNSDNPNRLIMTNIPGMLTAEQVQELVTPFGGLRGFILVQGGEGATSSALFEYEDNSVAETAVQGLNGLDLGGVELSIAKAGSEMKEKKPQMDTVIKLADIVSEEELKDDEEYADLREDVEEECKRFGQVVAMQVPRPKDGEQVPGVGSVYVRYAQPNQAAEAIKTLSGRKFGGNIVQVTHFPVDRFEAGEFA